MRSSQNFRIVFLGREFHQVFEEAALVLQDSLESLGFSCDVAVEQIAPDRINIFLGCHHLKEVPRDVSYIVYQLEPLQQERSFYCESFRQILLNSQDVWDYSHENVAFLKTQGVIAKYLPLGYHPKLEVISHSQSKDIDLYFCGTLSPRRIAYFTWLKSRATLNFLAHCMLFGPQRDAFFARARAVACIHQHPDGRLLGTTRAAYLLNNGCFFLAESCAYNPYPSIDLRFGNLAELTAMTEYFAAHPAEAQALGLQWQQQFRRDYPMVDLLRAVL